jgi:hypothetical protein
MVATIAKIPCGETPKEIVRDGHRIGVPERKRKPIDL